MDVPEIVFSAERRLFDYIYRFKVIVPQSLILTDERTNVGTVCKF